MTAADLVAGARALIEPLNGRNLFEAAPVMRDTIAALLDDRDALMQRIEVLVNERSKMLAALGDRNGSLCAAQMALTECLGIIEALTDKGSFRGAKNRAHTALQADEAAQ